MVTVADLLKQKKNKFIQTISPDESVYRAIEILAEKNLGALVVTGPDSKVLGIISERDYARKIVLKGKSSKETLVKEIMTTEVIYVVPEQTVDNCMALMINRYIRHLPVLEKNRLLGIISIGDVVKSVIGEQEFRIAELERYIGT